MSTAQHRAQATTRSCGWHDHPEVTATFDSDRTRGDDVAALLESFEEAVARGHRFYEGDLVRVGSGLLRLIERDRALTLEEPDFSAPELRFVVGIDATIAHLRAQEAVGQRLGVVPRFPALDQRAQVCSHLETSRARGFVLDRGTPSRLDSGIRIGCGDETEGADAHDVVEVTLHEVVCHLPAAAPFLALPPGATAAVVHGGDAVLLHAGAEHLFRADRLDGEAPVLSGVRAMPFERAVR
ncbi:MAG: hypothetical protein ACXWUG_17415 [Polyangiales bacterium]